jgi:hypothetical protein
VCKESLSRATLLAHPEPTGKLIRNTPPLSRRVPLCNKVYTASGSLSQGIENITDSELSDHRQEFAMWIILSDHRQELAMWIILSDHRQELAMWIILSDHRQELAMWIILSDHRQELPMWIIAIQSLTNLRIFCSRFFSMSFTASLRRSRPTSPSTNVVASCFPS